MNDLPALPTTALGRYRHYKGGLYQVEGVARHSESLEAFVLYRPLYAGAHEQGGQAELWIRPWAMFFGLVEVDGRSRQRFEPESQSGSSS